MVREEMYQKREEMYQNWDEEMDRLEQLAKKKGKALSPLGSLLLKKKPNPIRGGTPPGAVYLPEGVKFIRLHNVKKNFLDLKDVKYIAKSFHEEKLKHSQLKPEDVLLSKSGFSAVVPKDIGEANIDQNIVKIEVDSSKILPEYLSNFLNCDLGQHQMHRKMTGSIISFLKLDYQAIKSLKIFHPVDIKEQREIINKIRNV